MNDCFTCPLCSRVSYGTEDVRHQYCPCCGGPDLPKRCDHTLRAAIDRVQVTFTRLEAQQREHAKAAGIYAQAQMARATAKTDYDAACRELLNLAQAP